jgi:hypothetical protein
LCSNSELDNISIIEYIELTIDFDVANDTVEIVLSEYFFQINRRTRNKRAHSLNGNIIDYNADQLIANIKTMQPIPYRGSKLIEHNAFLDIKIKILYSGFFGDKYDIFLMHTMLINDLSHRQPLSYHNTKSRVLMTKQAYRLISGALHVLNSHGSRLNIHCIKETSTHRKVIKYINDNAYSKIMGYQEESSLILPLAPKVGKVDNYFEVCFKDIHRDVIINGVRKRYGMDEVQDANHDFEKLRHLYICRQKYAEKINRLSRDIKVLNFAIDIEKIHNYLGKSLQLYELLKNLYVELETEVDLINLLSSSNVLTEILQDKETIKNLSLKYSLMRELSLYIIHEKKSDWFQKYQNAIKDCPSSFSEELLLQITEVSDIRLVHRSESYLKVINHDPYLYLEGLHVNRMNDCYVRFLQLNYPKIDFKRLHASLFKHYSYNCFMSLVWIGYKNMINLAGKAKIPYCEKFESSAINFILKCDKISVDVINEVYGRMEKFSDDLMVTKDYSKLGEKWRERKCYVFLKQRINHLMNYVKGNIKNKHDSIEDIFDVKGKVKDKVSFEVQNQNIYHMRSIMDRLLLSDFMYDNKRALLLFSHGETEAAAKTVLKLKSQLIMNEGYAFLQSSMSNRLNFCPYTINGSQMFKTVGSLGYNIIRNDAPHLANNDYTMGQIFIMIALAFGKLDLVFMTNKKVVLDDIVIERQYITEKRYFSLDDIDYVVNVLKIHREVIAYKPNPPAKINFRTKSKEPMCEVSSELCKKPLVWSIDTNSDTDVSDEPCISYKEEVMRKVKGQLSRPYMQMMKRLGTKKKQWVREDKMKKLSDNAECIHQYCYDDEVESKPEWYTLVSTMIRPQRKAILIRVVEKNVICTLGLGKKYLFIEKKRRADKKTVNMGYTVGDTSVRAQFQVPKTMIEFNKKSAQADREKYLNKKLAGFTYQHLMSIAARMGLHNFDPEINSELIVNRVLKRAMDEHDKKMKVEKEEKEKALLLQKESLEEKLKEEMLRNKDIEANLKLDKAKQKRNMEMQEVDRMNKDPKDSDLFEKKPRITRKMLLTYMKMLGIDINLSYGSAETQKLIFKFKLFLKERFQTKRVFSMPLSTSTSETNKLQNITFWLKSNSKYFTIPALELYHLSIKLDDAEYCMELYSKLSKEEISNLEVVITILSNYASQNTDWSLIKKLLDRKAIRLVELRL